MSTSLARTGLTAGKLPDWSEESEKTYALVRSLKRSGNIGNRVLSARMGAFNNSTPKTFRTILSLAQHYDRVRVIFSNGSTSVPYTVAGCNVRALADLTSALPSPVPVSLPNSGVVPISPTSNRRSYLVSDWVDLSSLDRTDGGVFPLVCVDAYVSTPSSITILGNGSSDNFASWTNRANGRIWRMFYNDGDCVTTPANFVSSTARIQSPIIGVQYAARGRVVTVMGIGDSITDGRGSIIGEGWGVLACEELSQVTGVAVEWFNNGWAGASMNGWVGDALSDACVAGLIPDIVIAPAGSPNSMDVPITAANINICRRRRAQLLATAQQYQVEPILWTTLPVNPSQKNWDSSDALRRAYNEETLAMSSRGFHVIDMDAAIRGDTDSDGQVAMISDLTDDGIHPNDKGNSSMKGPAKQAIAEYLRFG